jgi:sporulation protein YlmC with PRC-barrel domain
MLRSLNELLGYKIMTIDDEIGRAQDFYFDDHSWRIRYVVMDTGNWLRGRRVLVSPQNLHKADSQSGILRVALTVEEIEKGPGIDSDLPVSLQEQVDLGKYAPPAPACVPGASFAGAVALPPILHRTVRQDVDEYVGDPCLRSVREVCGYRVHAVDGEIGRVEDFLVDTENWTVYDLVVDARNRLPGRRVLVAPTWVDRIDWEDAQVHACLKCEQVRNSPVFNPETPADREHEVRLQGLYGRR